VIYLSREQSREVDRIAIQQYGMSGLVLMENAARGVSEVAMSMLDAASDVAIVCGSGNNGGDGLAVGRMLSNAGHRVTIFTAWDRPLSADAEANARIARRMKLPMIDLFAASEEEIANMISRAGLVVDGLFGTGLRRPIDDVRLRWPFDSARRVLAIDVPSGLDCDSGLPLGAWCVRAEVTVTLGTSKIGYRFGHASHYTGRVVVADIGCPREIFDRVGGAPK
jgi:NAD(P)H-hydrate epimerase